MIGNVEVTKAACRLYKHTLVVVFARHVCLSSAMVWSMTLHTRKYDKFRNRLQLARNGPLRWRVGQGFGCVVHKNMNLEMSITNKSCEYAVF